MTHSSSSAEPGAILFDIDGTLVDSNYLHVHAWYQAFLEVGHPVDAWRIHRGVGMGSSLLLAELLGDDVNRLGERASDAHSRCYAELAGLQRPFDGAQKLVRAVVARGARTVLATSAGPDDLERLREVLELDDVVTGITSDKDVEQAKPEPDLIHAALGIADVPPERAVMVGDTGYDVESAARAGVVCVALRSGGVSHAELVAAGAVAVFDDAAHLLRDLDASPLAVAWH